MTPLADPEYPIRCVALMSLPWTILLLHSVPRNRSALVAGSVALALLATSSTVRADGDDNQVFHDPSTSQIRPADANGLENHQGAAAGDEDALTGAVPAVHDGILSYLHLVESSQIVEPGANEFCLT